MIALVFNNNVKNITKKYSIEKKLFYYICQKVPLYITVTSCSLLNIFQNLICRVFYSPLNYLSKYKTSNIKIENFTYPDSK